MRGVLSNTKAKRRLAAKQAAANMFDEDDVLAGPHRRGLLETAVEKAISSFLEQFKLSAHVDAVVKLTTSGFTSVTALRAFDEAQGEVYGIMPDDSAKIVMAAWLDSNGLVQYGGSLVESGATSLLKLLRLSDERLKKAGIAAIGHRRQLQRFLRQDEELQARAAKAKEAEEAADAKSRGLYRAGGASRARGGVGVHVQGTAEAGQLRFEPVGHDGTVLNRLPEGVASSLQSDKNADEVRADVWYQPWADDGQRRPRQWRRARGTIEAHRLASAASDGFILRQNDGTEMRVW